MSITTAHCRAERMRWLGRLLAFLVLACSTLVGKAQSAVESACAPFTLDITMPRETDSVMFLYSECKNSDASRYHRVKNGRLTISGHINRACEALFFTNTKVDVLDDPSVIRFILEPGKIQLKIKGKKGSTPVYTISGSASERENEAWKKQNKILYDRKTVPEAALSKQKSAGNENNHAGLQKTRAEIEQSQADINRRVVAYIRKHPSSYFSGHLLNRYKSSLGLDSAQMYFSALGSTVKASEIGQAIRYDLFSETKDWTFRQENMDAADFDTLRRAASLFDFSLQDTTGKAVSLGKLRGRYTYLNFWASWCAPCIRQIPALNAMAEKYKNIHFLSVSTDEKMDAWLTAEKTHKPSGDSLLDNSGLLRMFYNAPWMPYHVLIDPQGKVYLNDAPPPGSGELNTILNKLTAENTP